MELQDLEIFQIHEGSYLTKTFVVNSSQTNQRYILPNSNIDTSSIRVEVEEKGSTEVYNAYTNIFDVNDRVKIVSFSRN